MENLELSVSLLKVTLILALFVSFYGAILGMYLYKRFVLCEISK